MNIFLHIKKFIKGQSRTEQRSYLWTKERTRRVLVRILELRVHRKDASLLFTDKEIDESWDISII